VDEQERSEKQGKKYPREDDQEEVEGQGWRVPREDEEPEETPSEESDDVEGQGVKFRP
jgi:hypothetical protein